MLTLQTYFWKKLLKTNAWQLLFHYHFYGLVYQLPVRGKLKYMGPSLHFLPWLFEILRKSSYKIDDSGKLCKLWDVFCLLFLIHAKLKLLWGVAIRINKPHQAKASHSRTWRHSTYTYLKYSKALETTLTRESSCLLAKLALPIHLTLCLVINVKLSR